MSRASPATPANVVLVDTCMWIDAERDAATARHLASLIQQDRVAMCGIVYAEVLRGIASPGVRALRAQQLTALQWLQATPQLWRETAELARGLDRKGRSIPLTDAHVAAVCAGHGLALWSTDRHFDAVPGLRRFEPSGNG